MKHAYLIIAHHEPEILQLLISALDDGRNDIYVHIDKKAPFDGAELHVQKSRLVLLDKRWDARWGDFSLVEVEIALFKEAYKQGPYAYYHLLSGVDLPLQSQDYIHAYCAAHSGTEFIGFAQNVTNEELRWRSQHYFLFAREFNTSCLWKRALRYWFVKMQDIIRYRRIRMEVKKGAQWCSVTHDFVGYLLLHEKEVRKYFRHTYCPDELFIQTLCWNSDFRRRVYSFTDEFEGCKRYIKWVNGELLPFICEDLNDMQNSARWFARKFDSENWKLIQTVTKHIEVNIKKEL